MRSWADLARMGCAAAIALSAAACGPQPDPAPTVGRSEPPRAVRTPPPTYPDQLGCDGIGGQVDLRVTIEPTGRVGAVAVERSSRQPLLDQAAIDAVRAWEFRPATRGGRPAPVTIAVPMKFNPPVERPERCFALDEQR